MLRLATPSDLSFIRALWRRPGNEMFLAPEEAGELEEALEYDHLVIWERAGAPLGFALLTRWVLGSYAVSALAITAPGQGEGTRFLAALLDWLFAEPEAHRIALDTTVDNGPALRLFEKLGFQREGLYRECWKRPDGRRVDCVALAILRREWQGHG
ncbi:GNAT family N-acetyltransferase [Paracoccus aminophilus]|uniref:Acetyltransferase n=1 Tax=Paracoccus aminophilus JCM 7686 TaxID=1367847 RepID=S5Y8J2_PARAH|nr:GNAT family protein [Paracoccus aminophilus]AGT07643.1 acetyltransferase [Paracoccus aminophilus JCM 7686]